MFRINGFMVIALYSAMFFAMIGAWRFWPKSGTFLPILIIATVLRALMLPLSPNDDINRYIWEGRIQNAGFNPFRYAPASPALALLRGGEWRFVNHKELPAIYGPLSELVFRLCSRVSRSPFFFKLVFILFDLGVVLFLILLMRAWSMEPRHLILYAFNPLALYTIAGEGHMESLLLFWLVGACYFLRKERPSLMYLFFGLATATTLLPVVLLPFLINRKNAAFLPLAIAPPVLLYVLYAAPGLSFLSVVFCFATQFHFNGFAATLFACFLQPSAVPPACLFLFAVIGLYLFFFIPDPLRALMYGSGAFFLCATTSHPWYLLLVTVFLPFYRSWPWITLHLTVAAAMVVSLRYDETGVWRESRLLWLTEYIPLAGAALWCALRGSTHAPASFRAPSFLSIIVPVLNERNNIDSCVGALKPDPAIGHEIIVVDGGSLDGTPGVTLQRPDIRTLASTTGRGIQIRAGIAAAKGDTVLVLHADCRPDPTIVTRVAQGLRNHPHAAGGAFHARYRSGSKRYRFTAFFNDLRTRWTGISFGDQAQFFRREAVGDRFPAYKLMEDLELSFLMKERGGVLFLPSVTETSTRRWERDGYIRNFIAVTGLTIRYIVQRRFGLLSNDCGEFHRRYYSEGA